jgi:O-antigen/teichoic acid export membrane protein
MSQEIRKLAGQTAVYGLGTIVPRLLNYLLTPFLTYGFSAAEFGINSELYAYMAFLNVLFTYGMETTFFNFQARNEDKAGVSKTAFTTLLSSSLLLSVLLFLFVPWISRYLSTPNAVYLPDFIYWSVLIIASDAIAAIPFARLRSENKAFKFSLLKLLNVVINFSLTLFFLKVCRNAYINNENSFYAIIYRPEVGIGYAFLANLIANFTTVLLLTPQMMSIRLGIDKKLLREMLSYSWPLLIVGLAGMVNETFDRIILKRLLPDKVLAQNALGIYGACYKIAILMTIFRQAFQFAAEPFFFGKAKELDSNQTYALVMKYFVIFCLLIFLGTMMNMIWIQYFIGENFRSGLHVVPILLLANLCLGVVYNLSIWFKISSKTGFGAFIALAGALITVVINFAFIPSYSYVACAWATLAAYAGMMIISYFVGQKFYPVKYNLRAIGFYSCLAFSLYLLSFSYARLDNVMLKLILNNLLVLIFVWFIYKFEFLNLRKIKARTHEDKDH